ncbi:MAG: hypothetical protein SVU32_08935 [Candidatus Nanohaloarchaea archaeon]|nr:hypothetical protein [Candidatus Nanohaloarchaea archaeon]
MSHEPLLATGLSLLLPVLGAVYLRFDRLGVKVLVELLLISLLPSVVFGALIADMTIGIHLLEPLKGSPLIFVVLGGVPLLLAVAILALSMIGNDWTGMKRMLLLFGMSYLGQILFITGFALFFVAGLQHSTDIVQKAL